MTHQTERFLKDAAVYALTFGVIVLIAVGGLQLVNRANVRIETRCQDAGGQVLRTPGEVSRCLLPITR